MGAKIDIEKIIITSNYLDLIPKDGPFMFSQRKNLAFNLMVVRSALFQESVNIKAKKKGFDVEELEMVKPSMPLNFYESYLGAIKNADGEIHASIWAINYLRADILMLRKGK